MAEYLCEEDMSTGEYISRDFCIDGNTELVKPVIYTFTVYYKFNDDPRIAAVDHTIILAEDYEQAAQECMKYFEDVLDEFDAVPVGITLKGSEPFES